MVHTEEEKERIKEVEDKLFPLPHLTMAYWHHFLNQYVMVPFDARRELRIHPVDFERLISLLCRQTVVTYCVPRVKSSGFIFRGIKITSNQHVDQGRVRVVMNDSIWQEFWVVIPEWDKGE